MACWYVFSPNVKRRNHKALWKIKGNRIHLKLGNSSLKVRYRFNGKELAVVPPGKARLWIILTRLSRRP